jgi:hypothetical protein
MPCEACWKFPVPRKNFPEVGISVPRHGTLYQCQSCRTYIELIAEERSGRFISEEELRQYYPEVLKEKPPDERAQ